jgi:hypothetical protein
MKFSAFYGHVAKAMGLTGLITHRNSFMNSPMVVSSKARKTDFSNKMPDMLPFGEYSVEAVDFDNPQHKAVAQAQLNKNLLPASIQMSSTNTVDDVYKRFGITKQEPQEPEKTGDVSPTVKSMIRGKPTDQDTADELQAAGQATTDPSQTTPTSGRSDRLSADGGQAARKVGKEFGKKLGSKINKDKMPTGTYAYDRYVPIPKNLNRLFRGKRDKQYYVDRIPLPGRGLMSAQLQITSDTKGTGFETVHDTKFNRARDAIYQFLKDNNTALIDQAEWAKLKKWNDMAGDGPGGGDILNAPNDRWKTKRKVGNKQSDQKPSELQGQDVNDQSVGSWGTDTSSYQGSERKYPHFIRQTAFGYDVYVQRPEGVEKVQGGPFKTEEAANEFARGRASKIIPDPRPPVTTPTTGNGKSDESDLQDIQQLNTSAENMMNILTDQTKTDPEKKTAYNDWFNTYDAEYQDLTQMLDYRQTSDELKKAINDLVQRQKNVINTYKNLYGSTANAGPPSNVDHLNQTPNSGEITNQGTESTSDQGRRFIAVPYTGPHRKTSNDHVIKDRQNPNFKSDVYPNKESAEKVANSMEKMPSAFPTANDTDKNSPKSQAKQTGVGSDGSAPETVDQRKKGNIPGLDVARKKLDNSSTDFTRLLKNAGLLKEFY